MEYGILATPRLPYVIEYARKEYAMPIIKRKCREDGFAQINNAFLQREDLAYDTKGMLCELFSRPDDWTVYKTQLERSHTKKTRLTRMFKEAQSLGYMSIENARDDLGHIIERIWNVSTDPVQEWIDSYRKSGYLKDGKPQVKETLSQGNRPLQIKTNTNKDLNTNKEISTTCIENKIPLKDSLKGKSKVIPAEVLEEYFLPAYELYPGPKGEYYQCWHSFQKGCKLSNLDPLSEVELLLEAVKEQINYRVKAKGFVPEWRGFAAWLSSAYWHWQPPAEPDIDENLPEGYDKTQDDADRAYIREDLVFSSVLGRPVDIHHPSVLQVERDYFYATKERLGI